MVRSWMWGAAIFVVLLLVGILVLFLNREEEPGWTSRSPEALKELEAGLEDAARSYWTDAVLHFERALELDPDMPAAKLQLVLLYNPDGGLRQQLWQELESTDLDTVSDRERFLISYWLTRRSGEIEDADAQLDAYLQSKKGHEDLFALTLECDNDWERQLWDEAETCYRRLISLHPNWVRAQMRLGLIAMARGQWDLAEESFQTFRFIAPDQAAPHDTLGQLQTVRGLYSEAEQSLNNALETKSDYCMAAYHLQRLYFMSGQWDRAAEALDRMMELETCAYLKDWGVFCASRAWVDYVREGPEAASEQLTPECLSSRGDFDLLAYRLAVLRGDLESAQAMEEAIESHAEGKDKSGFQGRKSYLESLLAHVKGVRSYAAGEWSKACDLFKRSDDLGLYWGLERASFKLYNRQHLMRCYEKSGHPTGAQAIRQQIEAVNPRFLEINRLVDLEQLGEN